MIRKLFIALTLLPLAAQAQSFEVDGFRDRLRMQATLAATEILRMHCPDRCQLLDVRVEVDEGATLAHVQPGFEELSPTNRELKARSVELTVLLDARLPADFRRDLVGLIKARLKSMPVAPSVRAETVAFPQPLAMPMPPSLDRYEPPAPAPTPEPEKEPAPPPEPFDPTKALQQRLIEASPWLLAILLISAALLLVLREISSRRRDEEDDEDEETEKANAKPPEPAPRDSAVDRAPVSIAVRRLNDELVDNPRLRSSVFRELIVSGNEEKFGAFVKLLGPQIADGLREDPVCRPALRRVGATLRAGQVELPEDEARRLLKELEGRIIADRLEGGGSAVEDTFSFLDKLTPAQFRRLLEGVSARAQGAALRFAPPFLRDAALEGLEPSRRRTLFLATAESGAAGTPELAEIADELRMQAARLAPGSDLSGLDLLTDLLDSQGEPEQAALLDALAAKPAVRNALLARMCTEATLGKVDEDVLAGVSSSVDVVALVDFLRGTEAELKDRFLAAAPRSMASALREELSLAVSFQPAKFAAARRVVLKAARTVIEERGLALEELNAQTPRRAIG